MIGINDACEILSWAYNNNIEIWLDGGWGVDALLGKETRQHNDIDLFVEEKNYNKFIEIIKNTIFSDDIFFKLIISGKRLIKSGIRKYLLLIGILFFSIVVFVSQ